ncbi:MAG: four-helix bundle copper-binding protein [Caulobacterales bacterium]|nr:four-helix bundle copper-binding protein [Caulobacterales bacterium]
MHAQEMIATHPHVQGSVNAALIRCIDECYDCAQACVICADACLGEEMVQSLLQCIRLNQDCADLCAAAGAIAWRRTGSNETVIRATLQACAEACRVCAEECERHAKMHEHCRISADSCRRCEDACTAAIQTVQ